MMRRAWVLHDGKIYYVRYLGQEIGHRVVQGKHFGPAACPPSVVFFTKAEAVEALRLERQHVPA